MRTFRKATGLLLMMGTMFVGVSQQVLAGSGPQVKTEPQVVTRLAQVLERSGYPYRKAADNVWVVSFKGKSLVDIQVIVTSVEDLIVMGAVVAPKSSMKVGQEMMFKLLKLTHDIDRVKIGFDSDDDLFVRAEVTAKCFDSDAFKSNMEQVSGGADQVHAAIRSSLVKMNPN